MFHEVTKKLQSLIIEPLKYWFYWVLR